MTRMTEVVERFMAAGTMAEVYKVADGPVVVGAWSRDVGTMERRLKLALVYPDGEISPVREYAKRKLTEAKALNDLADLDGIAPGMVNDIYKAVMKQHRNLPVQEDRNGQCSIMQAYRALCEYVWEYEEPGKVFIRDGYGNILASYLPSVLKRLELGYSRLELEKNLKSWNLLRVNNGTGHPYTYKINTGGANNWFLSFRLPEKSEVAA